MEKTPEQKLDAAVREYLKEKYPAYMKKKNMLADMEKVIYSAFYEEADKMFKGNNTYMAEAVGINRNTALKKLKEYVEGYKVRPARKKLKNRVMTQEEYVIRQKGMYRP